MKHEPIFPFSIPQGKKGFTLIELLIVIAIILILIAIALPNFLEAQIRARVTKARGEMRTLGIAMEAYRLDWNKYPSYNYPNYTSNTVSRSQAGFTWLTSPNAYITSIPEDPFPGEVDLDGNELTGPPYTYTMDGAEVPYVAPIFSHPHSSPFNTEGLATYVIFSLGPDRPGVETVVDHFASPICSGGGCSNPISSYSPTNGTKSKGDLFLYGGDRRWMGVDMYPLRNVADPARWKTTPHPGQVVDGVRFFGTFPPHLTLF